MKVRLPVAPLFAWADHHMRVRGLDVVLRGDGSCVRGPVGYLADLTTWSPDSVGRWKRTGHMSLNVADEVATQLGLHPNDVWGDIWWEACDLADLELDLSVVRECHALRDELDALVDRLRPSVQRVECAA